ncbi:hypothetical protein A9261_18845 [Vibrio tasmaniensis]|nr:hypothetical protein A9261_18845 [Vibrio tasmaniensis]
MFYINKHGAIESQGGETSTLNVLDNKFVDYVSYNGSSYVSRSIYSNEIFLYFHLKILEWTFLLSNVDIKEIKILNKSSNKALWYSYLSLNFSLPLLPFFLRVTGWFFFLISFLLIIAVIFIVPFLFFLRCLSVPRYELAGTDLLIARSSATYNKLKGYCKDNDINLLVDGIAFKSVVDPSFLSLLNMCDVFLICVKYPFHVLTEISNLLDEAKENVDFFNEGFILFYYKIRLPLSCLYDLVIDSILSKGKVGCLYTGNKEDRFALIEERVCKRYGVDIICLPHGIEYGFKLPCCPIGSKFYTTTERARDVLNDIYSVKKFIYDKGIMSAMLSKKAYNRKKGIVFFTEARGININKKIMRQLNFLGVDFSVKFHPKDCIANYNDLDFSFSVIKNFDMAITNSICLSRKSSILLEALYNNSSSIAVLIDANDVVYVEHIFPSLSSSEIMRIYTLDEMKSIL